MNSFLKKLDRYFVELADKIALRDDISQPGMTYRQLDELSGRVYGYLKEHNIGREDTVFLLLPRSSKMLVGMIGVWKAGASFVVCEDSAAPERVEYIRRDCNAKLVIDNALWIEIMEHEPLPGRETVHPHDLAYIVYTSGTTGNPKGTMHEFGNIDQSATFLQYRGELLFRESDTLGVNAPMNFVAYQDYFNTVIYAGAAMFIVPYSYVKNPAALIDLYEQAGITCTFMTSSSFRVPRCQPAGV